MTVQFDHARTSSEFAGDQDFELDVRFAESGSVVADLLRLTDDGCGSTCQSACTSSGC